VLEAVRLHELRLDGLRGAARVEAMEHLADLLPPAEHARLRTLLREIVREEPERRSALERLAELERSAGAWQREMSGIADWVRGINLAGEVVRLDAAEIQWGYRTAVFPEPLVIIEAALRLVPDDPEAIGEREDGWHEARRRTQPLGEASAGCVFKNPPGQHASQLIEAAGLKGERIGGAVVSPVHANFIVNTGGATADQVVRLVERVRERVRRAHGVELDLEVQMIGITAGGGD